MPFYVRKSLRFGPIRFNLSNSGLGVSTGVKGFRVGTGPRGNYVHIGAGGLFYRASLSSPGKVSQPPAQLPPDRTDSHSVDAGVLMVDVDSGDAGQIVDSSSQALVEELRQKKRIEPLAPWFLGIVVGANLYAAYKGLQPGFVAAIAAAAIIGFVLFRRFDAHRKTTVIFYDFGDGTENTFRGIHDAFEALANVQRIWHIPSKGEVRDGKYHAGANELVRRTRIHVGFDAPPLVKTNIPTPSLSVGTQKLYFFPDRLLIFEKSSIGGVSYSEVGIHIDTTAFIEDQGVPSDSETIGQTWRYVNKKGGPDRRFKDNRELPIARYEVVHLTTTSGLNELLHVSRVGTFQRVRESVAAFSQFTKELT